MKKIRIGSGAGYSGDRLEPALTLLEHGQLDYIGFECLAERTIALAQREKQNDPTRGYDPLLAYRMESVLPLAHRHGVKIITNMGAANPTAALDLSAGIARKQNLRGMTLAAVLGDDVLDLVRQRPELPLLETGEPLASIADRIVSANAYLGSEVIVAALRQGADVVLTGRVADPALFLAPMIHAFGWASDAADLLGKGTLVGHLLECAGQVSGGYFADPGKKDVPDLWNLGFPFAEVAESGEGFLSKVAGTGGRIDPATCTEQLLYEIHDPARYITPDCVADFSRVTFTSVGEDRVAFRGASGRAPTDTYKVSVGYRNGFTGTGEMSYGGPNGVARARLAGEIVRQRLAQLPLAELRVDLIGLNAIAPFEAHSGELPEVRLRVSGRAETLEQARRIGREVEALYTNGPAGGGGATQQAGEVISVASVLLPKTAVQTRILYQKI